MNELTHYQESYSLMSVKWSACQSKLLKVAAGTLATYTPIFQGTLSLAADFVQIEQLRREQEPTMDRILQFAKSAEDLQTEVGVGCSVVQCGSIAELAMWHAASYSLARVMELSTAERSKLCSEVCAQTDVHRCWVRSSMGHSSR